MRLVMLLAGVVAAAVAGCSSAQVHDHPSVRVGAAI